ncbi:MAG: class I SAM-dependent methyltransferase [Bacteroidales bacterium]|nr:class I SAM-dependent methyltransferase [Bacteroidales bacterium]
MELLSPGSWNEYELIDSGGLEKLERFGEYILARPEPQAVWRKALPEAEWEHTAHARYRRTRGTRQAGPDHREKGEWIRKKVMPDQWNIGYHYKELDMNFRLGLTAFGHIGIFPEQAGNWNYIYDLMQQAPTGTSSRVLNLFAYTGGSSLAARAGGAEVVHVDSVKPVMTWAREMMEASGLKDIRWVVEDALKFVRREVKRGNRYHGIILDPPAYGRGPEGEKWVLEESIDEMIYLCRQLADRDRFFLVMSLYSMGFSPLISESLIHTHFEKPSDLQSGVFYVTDRSSRKLPMGTFLRFHTH